MLKDIQQDQLNNIIDALIGSVDFGGWAEMLSSADTSALPVTATFFIPDNDAVSRSSSSMDPFLVPYHIVPQRLSFADLRRLAARSRLPTLLPSKSILITANTPSNFTIDDSAITQPDLFLNTAVSVHGIQNLLNYSAYGDPTPPNSTSPAPVPIPEPRTNHRPDAITDGNKLSSSAVLRCHETILAIFTGFCAFRIIAVAN